MRQRMSLAGQFLLLQLGIVLMVVCAVAAVSIAESDAAFRREVGAQLRSVGENVAINRTVRLGLADPAGQEALAAVAESARAVSGASYVLIADATGKLVTGPDAGTPAVLGASTGLAGRSWVGVIDDGSKALVAHVPVLDESNGRFLGLIVVGQRCSAASSNGYRASQSPGSRTPAPPRWRPCSSSAPTWCCSTELNHPAQPTATGRVSTAATPPAGRA